MRITVVALMIALQAFGALATIALVGKPRSPLTGATAAVTALLAGLFIAGILYLA